MRIRLSRLGKIFIAPLLALALILIPAAAAGRTGSSTSTEARCQRPFSSTLLETRDVRIYAMPKESEQHPEHREPSIAGRPLFACFEATGRSRLLDLPEVEGEGDPSWVAVDEQVFATNAPLFAYAYSQYYRDTHETWIQVRNLLTGRMIRTCKVGGAIAPEPGPRVTDIVLSATGEVGWNAQGEPPESGDHVAGCNPRA